MPAGAGPTPYSFSGPVYLTGPYNGAPFGLSIVVPAVAGPFNLGNVVTRSTINVDPTTARVTVNNVLPTIVKGVPIRLRNISVNTNKQGFLFNPTNCSLLATESTVTSTLGATQSLSTPFQVANCSALAFKPTFKSTAGGKTSKANGASLETTINQPAGEANINSVLVQLPKQLPSRLTTLHKACPEKTFAANPYSCDAGAFVGTGRANTPTLPGKLQGPAILVSHGGEAFPDLDLVMEANGVRVILVGNTNITKGITTTNFATTPDVPVSSVTVILPTGPHSALAANGNLCTSSMVMPTTITGQNGKTFKQNTKIAVSNCPVQIVGKKVVRQHRVPHRPHVRSRTHQRQRAEPLDRRPASEQRAEASVAQGAAQRRRPGQGTPAERTRARRLLPQEARCRNLGRIHDRDLPLEAPGGGSGPPPRVRRAFHTVQRRVAPRRRRLSRAGVHGWSDASGCPRLRGWEW